MDADSGRAKTLLSEGKYSEAAEAFRQIAEKNPKHKEAWDNMAFALVCAGDVGAAAACYSEIIRRYPKDHDAMYHRAVLELKAGFPAEALDSINKALILSPGNAEYLYTKGCIFYEMKKLNDAIACFDDAVRADPYHYIAADHICLCLFSLGSFSELAAFCLQCIRMYEPFVSGDFERLGPAAGASGDQAAGSVPEGSGSMSGSGSASGSGSSSEIPESLKGFGPENLLSFYNYLSLGCLRSGDYEDASRFLKTALTFDADNTTLTYYLAMAQTGLGKYDEAVSLFRKVLASAPDSPGYRRNLAYALSQAGRKEDIDEATGIYRRLLSEDPDNRKLSEEAAGVYRKAGLSGEALAIYDRILEKYPNDLTAYGESSKILFMDGDYEKAAQYLEKGCSLDPYDFDMVNLLAVSYMNLGRTAEAEKMFEKAAEIDPWSPKPYYNEGIARLKCEQYEKAAACFRKAAECAPDDPAVLYYLGIAETECGLYEEALACFEKVAAVEPDYEDVQQCLAYIRETLTEEKEEAAD